MKTPYPVQLKFIILLIFVTILGFAAKYVQYEGSFWINNHLAGLFYEIFWCLFTALFFTRTSALKISLTIFIITGALEILQLWHAPFLTTVRTTFIGRTLIGTSFSWLDFPFYFLGCAIGWLLIVRLKK